MKTNISGDSELDPISTALLSASATAAVGPIGKLLSQLGAEKYAELSAKFESCFQGHVDSTKVRCSKIKNILYRDNAVDFMSQYVPISFGDGRDSLSDAGVLSRAVRGQKVLISGTAGAGKTMFMRWATLDLIGRMKNHGRVPLYLEMRYFHKDCISQDIEKYIWENTSSNKDTSSFLQFSSGLKSGLFVIMLDAIDEINPDYREKVVRNLISFMEKYPECGMIVSSRPDDKLESIQEFSVLRTMPMNIDQIMKVVQNLEYDEIVKDKLLSRLREGLYNELEEFLSNPLLATIMLLSFDYSADIPTKLTAFYQQAFEALYQRHDAAKGAYKRNHYAELPLDQFQNVFSAFCFQTYLNYKFEFTDTELLEAFTEACEYTGETANPELIVKDSMESVCVIQREGLDNVFSHRSFQEYFCALFISKYKEADAKSLINAVAVMENRSNVLKMLVELSEETFEYEWLLPLLEDFTKKYGRLRLNTKTGLAKFFGDFCDELYVGTDTGKVEVISWTGFVSPLENMGKWMGVAQNAYGISGKFYGELFRSQIWDPETKFGSIPASVRPSEQYIIECTQPSSRAETSSSDFEVHISAKDAPWLIYTNLPEAFERVRKHAIQHHKELLERRSTRRTTVKALLQRHRTGFRLPRRPRSK